MTSLSLLMAVRAAQPTQCNLSLSGNYYIEQQNNVRGKKSVLMWEGALAGTEVTDQQPLGLK